MTVLSANKTRPVRPPPGGLKFRKLPLCGYTDYRGGNVAHTVYKGSVVGCDVSDSDGYFHAPLAIGTVLAAAGDIFGGIAVEKVEVTSGDLANGKKEVTVAVNGVWGFALGSLDITDIGAPVYAQDDDSVTDSSTNAWWVGTVVAVDATYIWVDISKASGQLNVFPT